MADLAPEPKLGFDDSRRLTGPNRWTAGTAVTLTPLGAQANDAAAHARWAAHVRRACAHLGWPDPQPQARPHPREPLLVFAAPADQLFTATEVNEWAWECSAAEAGETGFDRAQDLGDAATALAALAARAATEHRPAWVALAAAAAQRDLPLLADDEQLSIGAGAGSRSWPLAALPEVDAVPWSDLHALPTALVTGSNGKTTTVRLLAAIARQAGLRAGLCSTEGVVVDGVTVEPGDYSGPAGARAVLRHPAVQLAVLETARGGLLRRGLAVDIADAAAVTNISADHLGEYGIDSLADIAHTKLVVARALAQRGTLVLNAADAVLMQAAHGTPHVQALFDERRVALFARDHTHPALAALRAAGGRTCGVRDGRLLLGRAGQTLDLGPVADFSLTLGGAAPHNTDNIAVAVLLADALQLPDAAVAQALARFGNQPADNPGRLERWTHRGATVLVDYAHNPDGLAQLLAVAQALRASASASASAPASARLGLLLGQAGNRDDAALRELALTAARHRPDFIVIKELPAMLRGRPPGAVPALIEQTLRAAGMAPAGLRRVGDEEAAALNLLAWAQPGDVVVLPIHTAGVRARLVAVLQGAGVASGLPFSTT